MKYIKSISKNTFIQDQTHELVSEHLENIFEG